MPMLSGRFEWNTGPIREVGILPERVSSKTVDPRMPIAQQATPLGTLAASRDFEAAGTDRRQAEAIATSLGTAVNAGHSELATRTDLAKLETKQSTVAVGVVLAQTALVSGLLKPVH